MEPYEEQQSDRLEEIMPQVKDIDQLENVEAKFKDIPHPNIGSRLGIRWIIYGYNEEAFPNLVNSASFGLSHQSSWIQTGYANSIGQSTFLLLNEFKYDKSFDDVKYKLIANTFICFSGLIRAMGDNAYDSLRTRAKLFEMIEQEPVVAKFLKDYYYEGNDLCIEILTLSDWVLSSIGYKNAGELENAKDSLEKAKIAYRKIISLPQYSNFRNLHIGDLTKISEQNQEHLFQKVAKDFLNGKFEIPQDVFRKRIDDERIKKNKGLFEF